METENKGTDGRKEGFPTRFIRGRTRQEKILVCLLVVSMLAVVGLMIAIVLIQHDSKDDTSVPEQEVCTSPDCVTTAARVMEAMDVSVDPCEDFYTFSCGSWQRSHVIPDDKVGVNRFIVLEDEVKLINKNLLEDEKAYSEIEAVRKAKDFYHACMSLDKMEELGASTAISLLEELGGWPVLGSSLGGNWNPATFDLVKLLVTLNKYNNGPLITLYVDADVKDSGKRIIYIDQAGFGLPGRDYYLDPSLQRMRDAYVLYARAVAELFGADPARAEIDMNDMLELETDVANISMRAEERLDGASLYNKMTLDQMAEILTEPALNDAIQFSWVNYVQRIFDIEGLNLDPPINGSEPIVVEAVPYFLKLFDVLRKYPPRTIANYLVWRIMKNRVKNLSQKFRDLEKDYKKALDGSVSEPTRWHFCVSYTVQAFSEAVSHMFVKETFNATAKNASLEMIKHIRESFIEMLGEVEWMDDRTKLLAKEKADATMEMIGYTDKTLDADAINKNYEKLIVDREDFFGNVLKYLNSISVAGLDELRHGFNRTSWTTDATRVNAFYSNIRNAIMLPAGILQPPFYSRSQPESMNYGGIGMFIGHEITHGFDDTGRQYDKEGTLIQWWDDNSINNSRDKTRCFVDQFSDFVVPEANLTINGISTLDENIADNGGLKQSYRAYRKWVKKQGREEPLLPGLNFNHNQLFFINFAQIWCTNIRPNFLVRLLMTGVHSPAKFRVIGTLQNSPDFAAAFNCPTTSYMSRQDKCVLW